MEKSSLMASTRLIAMALGLILLFSCAGVMETTDSVIDKREDGLSGVQRNSISMLNYLTVMTQQINASKYSRLYLEEAYSELINNISPNAVDARTLEQMIGILDTLESFRMVTVKRDRLKYYHEQKNAQTIRSLVPNPINILSIIESK